MMNQYYGYPGYEHMVGWGVFGLLVMIIFWIVAVFIIVSIVRRMIWGPRWRHGKWHGRHEMGSHSALNILGERYAKGEINKEEYEQKKKDLSVN